MIGGDGLDARGQCRIEISWHRGSVVRRFGGSLEVGACAIMSKMHILFIGDIVGKPGRESLRHALPVLHEQHDIDIVIANVENAAGGMSVTRDVGEAIRDMGVHVMTSGNHIWDKKEALKYIELEPRLIRPANYPDAPGSGHYVAQTRTGISVGVINVMGRVFMNALDNPFHVVRREIENIRDLASVILVDFHAEATSEKVAMGWYLDGDVTAVVGTHTHVQTADERVLPSGTAFITDVGMTGPHDSIIGVETRPVLARFVSGMPARFETASGNPRLNGVIITADPTTGRAQAIERVSLSAKALSQSASTSVSVS